MTATQNVQYPPLIVKDPSCLVPTKVKSPQEVVKIVLSAIVTICDPKLTMNLYSTFSKECRMLDPNHNKETIRKCFLEALTNLKAQLYSISRNNSPAARSAQELKEQNDKLWSQAEAIAKLIKLAFDLGELNSISSETNTINKAAIQKIKEEQAKSLTTIMCSNIKDESLVEALTSANLALNIEFLTLAYQEFCLETNINSAANSAKIEAKMEERHAKRRTITKKRHSLETEIYKTEEAIAQSEQQLTTLHQRNPNQHSLPAIQEIEKSIEERKKQLEELERQLEEIATTLETSEYSFTCIDKHLKCIEKQRNHCTRSHSLITQKIQDFKSSPTRNNTEEKRALTKAIIKITQEIKHNQAHCSEIMQECTTLEA